MARTLTDKQKLFCKYYTDQDNKETYQHVTNSAIAAGYTTTSAHVTGSRMLKEAKILEYISFLKKSMEEIFRDSAKDAAAVLTEIMSDPKQPAAARVKASTELLNRGGHVAKQEVSITHKGSINTEQSKEVHIIQQLINNNDDVADAIIKAARNRNTLPTVPEDVKE